MTALSRPYQIKEAAIASGRQRSIALIGGEVTCVWTNCWCEADIALHDAKAHGQGAAAEYNPCIAGERARRRAEVEEGLRQAVRRDELSLHWQPKVDLSTWKITSTEALLR